MIFLLLHCFPTLSLKCPKGRFVALRFIYFVELGSPMLHAKFQDHLTSGSGKKRILNVFTIYGHGGHLGHVT